MRHNGPCLDRCYFGEAEPEGKTLPTCRGLSIGQRLRVSLLVAEGFSMLRLANFAPRWLGQPKKLLLNASYDVLTAEADVKQLDRRIYDIDMRRHLLLSCLPVLLGQTTRIHAQEPSFRTEVRPGEHGFLGPRR